MFRERNPQGCLFQSAFLFPEAKFKRLVKSWAEMFQRSATYPGGSAPPAEDVAQFSVPAHGPRRWQGGLPGDDGPDHRGSSVASAK